MGGSDKRAKEESRLARPSTRRSPECPSEVETVKKRNNLGAEESVEKSTLWRTGSTETLRVT